MGRGFFNLKVIALFSTALVFGVSGCAQHRTDSVRMKPRPLGSEIPTFRPSAKPDDIPKEPRGHITVQDALTLALMKSPDLAVTAWEIRAREGAILQASLFPNPEISTEIEDLGGSAFSGTDQAEATISLGQFIELGGKRLKRKKLASLAFDLAGWDYEAKRIDLFAKVTQAFVDVLGAQENLALSEERVRLAQQVADTVSGRVQAGKVSPVEEIKAKVALASARIDVSRAKKGLEALRKQLAATWGGTTPTFTLAKGNLRSIFPIPSFDQLANHLSQNPEIARWATEISQRESVIDLERARVIPDITLSGGVRRFNETDTTGFVAGFSIPLPILNQNQGAIQEASAQLSKAKEERRATEVHLTAELTEAYRALSTSHSEVLGLQNNVLPGAEQAFNSVNEGYRLGKFGLLDVLDAQRTLFGARAQHLEALIGYHQAVAGVERLIGARLNDVKNTKRKD
ncbi:MAG: TolC family protein [Nitrospiria bacterium]